MELITNTDSYKFSHFNQYPEGTQQVYSYMEARGGEYKDIIFFGLAPYLETLNRNKDIWISLDDLSKLSKKHGVPFNFEGWKNIIEEYENTLPIEIYAVPEGSINKIGDVLLTITNTDDRFPWLVGWLETLLMKVWYPTTIASKSYAVKRMINKHYIKTSDNLNGVDFSYHNFGDRGSSSVESAAIGGAAHLTQFKGTDNFNSLIYVDSFYNEECAGYSIPATEHSTVTSWERNNEFTFYNNFLEIYKEYPLVACVMDSYNIYNAVEFVTSGAFKDKVESNSYPTFVIRPDSGQPTKVIEKLLLIMEKNNVSFSINSKGYKLFNKYRILWGDGITPEIIDNILNMTEFLGYAADNFAFGSGGDLMQNVNRDTCKFAIKCSAIKVNGEWRDVYKDPVDDKGKASKRGLVTNERLQLVYRNGGIFNKSSFEEIRGRSNV